MGDARVAPRQSFSGQEGQFRCTHFSIYPDAILRCNSVRMCNFMGKYSWNSPSVPGKCCSCLGCHCASANTEDAMPLVMTCNVEMCIAELCLWKGLNVILQFFAAVRCGDCGKQEACCQLAWLGAAGEAAGQPCEGQGPLAEGQPPVLPAGPTLSRQHQ